MTIMMVFISRNGNGTELSLIIQFILYCLHLWVLIYKNRINFNSYHMSVQISFRSIQIARIIEVEHNLSHSFTLQIFNKQFHQSMKTTFHSINKGVIDLPNNIFILPENAVLNARIEQNNQRRQLEKVLSFGQYQFNVDTLQLWDLSAMKGSNIKSGAVQFQTFNKNFKITLNYRGMYIKNKVFTGHFFGLLQNQGAQARNLLTIKQFHEHHHNNQSIDKQFEKTAQTIAPTEVSLKNSSRRMMGNCFNLCDRVQVDDGLDEVAQQDLPDKFSENIKSKSQTPKTKKIVNQINHISEKVQASSNFETKNKSDQKQKSAFSHSPEHSSKHKATTLIPLYKGTCKSNNLFSCLDAKTEDYQICVIEPAYKG